MGMINVHLFKPGLRERQGKVTINQRIDHTVIEDSEWLDVFLPNPCLGSSKQVCTMLSPKSSQLNSVSPVVAFISSLPSSTVRMEMDSASLVAWRCESLQQEGTVIVASFTWIVGLSPAPDVAVKGQKFHI